MARHEYYRFPQWRSVFFLGEFSGLFWAFLGFSGRPYGSIKYIMVEWCVVFAAAVWRAFDKFILCSSIFMSVALA
ncbi:hypothetical protein [Coleofasciculus sp.]|uniref:hypothetical protein n=1 Tax=Coleofasciculus sp. TaxID=3100458 RepID=UPI003A354F2E